MKSAVLFIVFNRLETTKRVFERIRAAKPPRLYISCDAPRPGRADEAKQVAAVREYVSRVNWPCRVLKLFQENNLGCKHGPATAITWFFQNEEEGIILEDDCVPDPSFFEYCDNLLERYRLDSSVAMISGNNPCAGRFETNFDVIPSRYAHIWGWASWRRAWNLYDITMCDWPELNKENWLGKVLPSKLGLKKYWERQFGKAFSNAIDCWDYQWMYSMWRNEMYALIPRVNMVENIGFGTGATHTVGDAPAWTYIATPQPMTAPFACPDAIAPNNDFDSLDSSVYFRADWRIYCDAIYPNWLTSRIPKHSKQAIKRSLRGLAKLGQQ